MCKRDLVSFLVYMVTNMPEGSWISYGVNPGLSIVNFVKNGQPARPLFLLSSRVSHCNSWSISLTLDVL